MSDRHGARAAVARIGALALAVALWAPCARAGQVVVITSRAFAAYDATVAGFAASYRGPVTRFALDDPDLASRIGALRPDAIVAVGLRAALFARDQFPRTPTVFCAVQDAARRELTGAWITGVTTEVPPAVEFAAWRRVAPDVRRVAMFYGAASGAQLARAARTAAAEHGFDLVEVPLADLSQLASRAREIAPRVDALWLPADPTVAASEAFQFLLRLSLDQRKPLFVFSDALVRAGAMAAIAPDYGVAGEQAAGAVRRIEAGERAGDIPVVAVRRTHVVVNEATARAVGLAVPTAVLRDGEVLK
ncbi:MAG: hypothetical protein HYR74_04550 [Candidatus Eisenbacteria bacterium]|nr:hypothetical protein [Candidatus Eisenbacteria bacterium]